jgi:hypothetical protein
MTAPTGLGQYVPPAASQGDRIQAQQMVDRPILVWVRRTQHLAKTKFSATGGEAVYLDFVDLSNNQVFIEVMWMAGAIVDGLKQYAGDGCAYPVKVVRVEGGAHGSYNTIKSLSDDPQWMNHVLANLPTFQQMVAQTRAQKEAEWATAMAQANQPPAMPGAPSGPPPAPALAPAGAAAPQYQQPGQPAQYGAPPAAAPPQQFQQAPPVQQPGQYGVPQQPVAPPAQPGYAPQQYAPPAQQQQPVAPPAAVAPPQYQQPMQQAVPPGPPPAAAPVQQYQQAAPQQQFAQAAPPPPQQYGPPAATGAVTGQTVEQLQQALNQIG